MSICVNVNENNFLTATNSTLSDCSEFVLLSKNEYETLTTFDISSMLNNADILAVYSWGVGAVLSLWVLGFVLSVSLGLIRKI